jgi:hypothetical protein
MAKNKEQAAVDALVEMASQLDYNVYIFVGYLLQIQHPIVKANVTRSFYTYLEMSERHDREMSDAKHAADLTEFDR